MKAVSYGMGLLRKIVFWGYLCFALLGSFYSTALSESAEDQNFKHFHVGYKVLDLQYPTPRNDSVVTVAVWYPTKAIPSSFLYAGSTYGNVTFDAAPYAGGEPYPLLVFSHGYGGSGLSATFFTEALAAHGWIVVAPDHHDKHSAVRIRTGETKDFDRASFMKYAKQISNSNVNNREAYMYRLDEIKFVLDSIIDSELFGKLIDREKISVGGHSFGGFTALGLCGTIKERYDARIKGVLIFSSGASGYLFRESELATVKVPSMFFLGEREKRRKRGTKTMAELSEKVYRNLSPPKYFLEVKGATHFSFNNRLTENLASRFLSGNEEQFDVIRRYSIAFLEKYVAGKKIASDVLKNQDPCLTRYVKEPFRTGSGLH